MKLLDQQVCFLDFGKHAFAPFVIRLIDFRDTDPPGGAVKKTCTKAFFELNDLFADRCPGDTKPPRGSAKPFKLHNIGEYFHRGQPVHIAFPIVNELKTIMS